MKLKEEIIHFFQKQPFTVVTTIDKDSSPHNACKGIVKINRGGEVYLLDLYKARTFENLKRDPNISITSVDEHKFRGYCLKGKAKIIETEKLEADVLKAWEDKITGRVTSRVIKNIRGEKGHTRHPEAHFPKPSYMIVMQVIEIINLTPHHLQ